MANLGTIQFIVSIQTSC